MTFVWLSVTIKLTEGTVYSGPSLPCGSKALADCGNCGQSEGSRREEKVCSTALPGISRNGRAASRATGA